ncbi:MutS-related protein [Dyadobacter sp. CY323]|uniref:MutS-related protein n=1 Tax=Dyadobacter sp. CY323 TaxID=2907302 RepID=UPI001F2BB9C8|nr:DNA mismatch repair protein MutS [Dyadobacter sp. CY323]MCE6991931.1 DNA mismatch repair protein MutS [Dyadobacter sp. CY323]
MPESKKKQLARLKEHAHKIKQETIDFFNVERFFHLTDKKRFHQVISDRTFQDLDMEEVFMFIDRTVSKVGQQFLYHTLRTIPDDTLRTERFEKKVKIFKDKPELKDAVLLELGTLQSTNAYYIVSLFLREHIQKPGWFWIIPLLSLASVSSVLLLFVFPQAFIALVVLLAVNFGFHYWNKNNLYQYANSIPQLSRMTWAAKKISELEGMGDDHPEIRKSIAAIESLGVPMSIFRLEAKLQSEIGLLVEHILELIKALFLIEPLALYHVLNQLDKKRTEIQEIYTYIGETDVAMSISFLRDELPSFCIPSIDKNKKRLTAVDIYHPLIYQSVANSIDITGKSALLTGSNMSGKTTFIRTIGINAILAQTINTCFAREFRIPMLKVNSAIRISDDLLNEKSYYFEEVLAVKALLEESRSGFQNLFLLDEMFKGTNTVERVASGKAVLEYLTKHDNLVFAATHDLQLADLLTDTFKTFHFTETVESDQLIFDYKIKTGVLTDTNAIRILELNLYPSEVTDEAKQLATRMFNNKVTRNQL